MTTADLTGKRALVTDASGVVDYAVDPDDAERLVRRIVEKKGKGTAIPAGVTAVKAAAADFEEMDGTFGGMRGYPSFPRGG